MQPVIVSTLCCPLSALSQGCDLPQLNYLSNLLSLQFVYCLIFNEVLSFGNWLCFYFQIKESI